MLGWNRSDDQLVTGALGGEGRAAEELVLRYQRRAYAVARAHLPPRSEPDDAVQEAFYQALRDLPDLRERDRFGPWFLAIVRNVARKRARSGPPSQPLDPEPPDPRSDTRADSSLEWLELRERIWDEVARLPASLREAVMIYYHDGRSVRSVAAAQGISVALAKKRLQLGRDRLRESLWRRLGETIEELLPSARGWKLLARRTSLPLLAALPARGALDAGALAPAGGTTLPAATVLSAGKILGTALGSLIMIQKIFLLALLVLFVAGVSFWAGRSSSVPASPPRMAQAPSVPGSPERDARLREVEGLRDADGQRIRDLETENQRLRERLALAPAPSQGAGRKSAAEAGSGLDWSDFSSLVARSREVLSAQREGRPLTRDEEVLASALRGELLKLSARAKSLSPNPFFDPAIFGELTSALLRDSLGLDAEQAAKLDALDRSIFAQLPPDAAEKTPLEKYILRREMARELEEGVEGILNEDQLERWEPVRSFAERVFSFGKEFYLGIEKENLMNNIKDLLSLDEAQGEAMKPLVEEYRAQARLALEKFGKDQGDIRSLSPEDRRRLDQEFLDLQADFEKRLRPLLREEQIRASLEGRPTILRFDFGGMSTLYTEENFF